MRSEKFYAYVEQGKPVRPGTKRRWEQWAAWWREGLTIREVAERAGVGPSGVHFALRSLGVETTYRGKRSGYKWTKPSPFRKDDRNARIVAARDTGMTVRAIAARFRISRTRVCEILKRVEPSSGKPEGEKT